MRGRTRQTMVALVRSLEFSTAQGENSTGRGNLQRDVGDYASRWKTPRHAEKFCETPEFSTKRSKIPRTAPNL